MNALHRGTLAALLLASACSSAMARPVPGGIEVERGTERLTVTAIDKGVLRVRIADTRRPAPADESWAVTAATRARIVPVQVGGDGFTAAGLSVAIDPATLAMTVRRADGSLVVADATTAFTRDGDGFTIRKRLAPGTRIFGMGDKTGGLDRAGKTFVNWNTDQYGFGASTDPLYKSIPFFIALDGTRAYGLFLDSSFRSAFDFGHRAPDTISPSADGGAVDYYLFAGPTLADVTRAYARLTGTPPMPPRWALGFQQSRYSYMSAAEVRALVARFEAENFPLGAVWLDIDFQDRNRPFTINRETFPDFEKLVGELAAKGVKTIPIVDLHIAAAPDQGYVPYESGIAGDHFLRGADGKLYVAPVWPGPSVFPDFTRAATRAWWGGLYAPLVRAGVGGIWNDMNEPAIFETPSKTMPLDTRHRIDGDDRVSRTATHAEVHNVYGMENARATRDGLIALAPNVRPFVMTRATYAGGQNYAVTWTGDNSSTTDHLRLAVAQTLNLGLSGFSWTATDVGGFIGGASPELMTRWFQYAAFMPLFRAHVGKGAPRAEPWADGPAHSAIRKRFVEERYRLMPYLYAVAADAQRNGDPVVRPIAYDYAGLKLECDDTMSFTLGGRLLVAGNPNPESPRPYNACLPEGGWYDYWTGKPVDRAATLSITPDIAALPVYVRAGSIIARRAAPRDDATSPLELHVYPGPACAGTLYDDDGISITGPTRRQAVRCGLEEDGSVQVTFAKPEGRYRPEWRTLTLVVHSGNGESRRTLPLPADALTVRVPAR